MGDIIVEANLTWSPDAESALERVPRLFRGLAKSKIEQAVVQEGRNVVHLADYERMYSRFRGLSGGKDTAGLDSSKMPAMKSDAPAMVNIEICHAELRGCPHRILRPTEWESAFREIVAKGDYDRRLREKVKGDVVLFHHRFRISISGCPNGCSQPQIKDFGVLGMNRLNVESDTCTQCRLCEEACPDEAITVDEGGPHIDYNKCLFCRDCSAACPTQTLTVGEPLGKIVIGGKVGRHPQWARTVAEFADITTASRLLETCLERYVNEGLPDERFANFCNRVGLLKECDRS